MTEITTPSTIPPTRYAVTIRYDTTEDRLLVYCGDKSGHLGLLQLTRRITGNLLQGMIRILSKGGTTLLRVPAEMQQDVLHFEHQSALSQAAINQTEQYSIPSKTPSMVLLVNTVNIRETPEILCCGLGRYAEPDHHHDDVASGFALPDPRFAAACPGMRLGSSSPAPLDAGGRRPVRPTGQSKLSPTLAACSMAPPSAARRRGGWRKAERTG